jgi:hypothetical protein
VEASQKNFEKIQRFLFPELVRGGTVITGKLYIHLICSGSGVFKVSPRAAVGLFLMEPGKSSKGSKAP